MTRLCLAAMLFALLAGPGADAQNKSTLNTLAELFTEDKVVKGTYRYMGAENVNGDITFKVTERDGKKVKIETTRADEKDTKLVTSFHEGAIDGNRMTLKSVGAATKSNWTLTLKGSGLEGTWTTSTGGMGRAGFKVDQ